MARDDRQRTGISGSASSKSDGESRYKESVAERRVRPGSVAPPHAICGLLFTTKVGLKATSRCDASLPRKLMISGVLRFWQALASVHLSYVLFLALIRFRGRDLGE